MYAFPEDYEATYDEAYDEDYGEAKLRPRPNARPMPKLPTAQPSTYRPPDCCHAQQSILRWIRKGFCR